MTGRSIQDADLFPDLRGPFLALDVGEARIGVAVSDPEALLARPLDTVQRIPRKECLDRFEALCRETGAQAFVVGLPLLESGEEGEQAERTRAFIRSLARRIPRLPVTWWDERYTTSDAKEFLVNRGERTDGGAGRRGHAASPRDRIGKRPRSRRDEIAATLLLQEWLDERRRRASAARLP